jgi:hypothetical protein
MLMNGNMTQKLLDKSNYTTLLSFLISGYPEEEYWEMT